MLLYNLKMLELSINADELVQKLLRISERKQVCILDSCGISHLNSHLMIAGIGPVESLNLINTDPAAALDQFESKLRNSQAAGIFTISYDFGLKLEKIPVRESVSSTAEPDIFLACFDCLVVHDYKTGKTFLTGNEDRFPEIESLILEEKAAPFSGEIPESSELTSNLTREQYFAAIEGIKEHIRAGDTYQANLTQQFRGKLSPNLKAQQIFWRLRDQHPAPFSAFIGRVQDTVVSISPERFISIDQITGAITASPIKGTRPRGVSPENDLRLITELRNSEKDRAENVMIVDLLRNDIGRICEFGTVEVEKLCDLESHPTLHHLVSTIKGRLKSEVGISEIIRAVFPCGSITGAPKIRTMQIIDQFEPDRRGLSMGAIGYFIPESGFDLPSFLDLNVAIRTMVVRNGEVIFNAGGGIVIDSDPESEYKESLLKAQALFTAINAKIK